MLNFKEDLLQFIWQNKLLMPAPLITKSGYEIFILKPGELNYDAGPDFFNAQIRINNIVLAGNIEIHLRTSDWLRHKHQDNKSYDNIILHAVYEHDVELEQNKHFNVEVLELKYIIAKKTIELYQEFSITKEKLSCANQLKTVNDLNFISWLERMTIERLEEKVKKIEHLFESFKGDYTQTFYALILRNFGFKVNALPFELIAKHLPIHILLKHADNLLQLEALLLGISGLLENQLEDNYLRQLQNEFEYLKTKYQLLPLKKEIFKFSKMRPANFPNVRLVQLATLIHSHSALIANPHQFTSFNEIKKALKIKPEGYWKHHYKIDGKELSKELALGEASAENLIVNSFAPFFFFYSKKLAKPDYADLAIDWLHNCKMELNAKTKLFSDKNSLLKSSADSQALINLYDNYCSKKRCLKCGIAASILKQH